MMYGCIKIDVRVVNDVRRLHFISKLSNFYYFYYHYYCCSCKYAFIRKVSSVFVCPVADLSLTCLVSA